ncbi:hypothetical protein VSS74_09915 [Conexibacter stalactiti]|uniref:Glycosyltransferase family 1 protein n=1 Tax=Conexibacter stalactiti TaxID=1940611 RepID=A0ABU4HPM0_9ACTN|nr:hypothetical protein [Conexibacter stalactiti]MDW5594652.1 hypothetical protein [Conexibacter stalactiti]MEC5035294.1 hypothetical protein [Conexibacter stalactiti]
MQIAAYANQDVPSSHYRAYQPMIELDRRGHQIDLRLTAADLEGPLPECEVAFLARYREPEARELVRALQAQGTTVVWDCDDDVVSVRLDGDAEAQAYLADLREMIQLVDVVTTTRDELGDIFLREGARAVITIPNYLAAPNLGLGRRHHEGIVIGWIAWIDHQKDWDLLGLDEVFKELLDRHEDLHVESVGPIDLRLGGDRYNRRPTVTFPELGPAIAGFDIGIAPLATEIEANFSRSDIKLKEYAVAGVPWLASPIGPYEGMGEEQGGRLVGDDDWFDAVDQLVRDGRGRRKLAKKGQRWGREHVLAHHVDVWEEVFYEAVELSGRRVT